MIIGRKAKGRFSNQNTKTQLGSLKHSSGLRSLPNKKEDAENNKKKRALKRTATSQLNIGGIFSCLGLRYFGDYPLEPKDGHWSNDVKKNVKTNYSIKLRSLFIRLDLAHVYLFLVYHSVSPFLEPGS